MTAPMAKGWCPGAHRPMRSGDGLVVRVRPMRGTLSATQVLALCHLADRFGNGALELTSRANLQLRGVAEGDHPALLRALDDLGLLDADPEREARRNILIAPDRIPGDLTDRLHDAVIAALPRLPALPAKMGHVLDTGAVAQLGTGSGDFRFEVSEGGGLILRADGAALGRVVTEAEAIPALIELAHWFVGSGGLSAGRMARHLRQAVLPLDWQRVAPRPQAAPPEPGRQGAHLVLGAPFGSLPAPALARLMQESGATALRPMLNRLFCLRHARDTPAKDFVTRPGAPLMAVEACPGAPACPRASTDTRALARQLAPRFAGRLHVSGCAKGCASQRAAEITLVGRDGTYDLVRNGRPGDPPARHGLTASDLLDLTGMT